MKVPMECGENFDSFLKQLCNNEQLLERNLESFQW